MDKASIIVIIMVAAVLAACCIVLNQGDISGVVTWQASPDGNLKVSDPYQENGKMITEVALSPTLVKNIQNNKMVADTAKLIANIATMDVDSAKNIYNKNWAYFDFSKQIERLKKTTPAQWFAAVLAKTTSILADKVSENCLTKIAQKKPADKDGWVRFKIVTIAEAKQNSRLYPNWSYVYVRHDWGPGYCTQDLGCKGSFKTKDPMVTSESCFG